MCSEWKKGVSRRREKCGNDTVVLLMETSQNKLRCFSQSCKMSTQPEEIEEGEIVSDEEEIPKKLDIDEDGKVGAVDIRRTQHNANQIIKMHLQKFRMTSSVDVEPDLSTAGFEPAPFRTGA